MGEYDFDPEEDYLAPYHVSQEGIAKALGMRENNVSREISKLIEDDLVEDHKARVKSSERKRKVYQLTEKGKKVKDDLKEQLKEKEIFIETKKGERLQTTIEEVLKILREENERVKPFHIAEWTRTKDVLDIEEFSIPSQLYELSKRSEEWTEVLIDAPEKKKIYGRKEELERLRSELSKKKPPLIIIEGIPGIGKTALGRKLSDEFRGKKHIFWYNFHEWDRTTNFYEKLKTFLTDSIGITLDIKNTPAQIAKDIVKNLKGKDTLLFFDNYEKMPDELNPFMEILLREKRKGNDSRLVIMTRETPEFFNVRDEMEENIFRIELGPMEKEYASEMIEKDDSDIDYIEEMYEKTNGHPLYLELVKKFPRGKTKMDDFLEREIYADLSESKKEFLEQLSVFKAPIRKDILLDRVEVEDLLELKKDNLIKETEEGRIYAHDILKGFFYENISIEKKKELHGYAADKLVEFYRESDEKIEVLYHLIKAGENDRALELMKNSIQELAEIPDYLRKELLNVPLSELSDDQKVEYFSILGDIFTASKNWGRAINFYQKALKLSSEDEKLQEKLGRAQMELEKWDRAVNTHENNLENYKEKGDKEGMFKEYINLGKIYRKKGDYKKSRKYYDKTASLIPNLDEKDDKRSILLNNLGMIHLSKKEYSRSEEMFKNALQKGGNEEMIHKNLGILYEKMGEKGKCLDHLENSIQIKEEKNNLLGAIETIVKKADSLAEFQEYDRALDHLKKALDMEEKRTSRFLRFGRKKSHSRIKADIYEKMADIYREKGELEKSISKRLKSIKTHEKLENKEKSAKEKLIYSFDLAELGKTKEALEILDEAEKELKGMENREAITAVRLEKARIYKSKGNYEKVRRLLNDLIDNASKRGDEKAIKEAEYILSQLK